MPTKFEDVCKNLFCSFLKRFCNHPLLVVKAQTQSSVLLHEKPTAVAGCRKKFGYIQFLRHI